MNNLQELANHVREGQKRNRASSSEIQQSQEKVKVKKNRVKGKSKDTPQRKPASEARKNEDLISSIAAAEARLDDALKKYVNTLGPYTSLKEPALWIKRQFAKDPAVIKAFTQKVYKERQQKADDGEEKCTKTSKTRESRGNARNRRLECKMQEPLQKFYDSNIHMQKSSSPYPFWNIVRNALKELMEEEGKQHLTLRPIHFVILQYRFEQYYLPKLMQTIYAVMCATKRTSLSEELVHLVFYLLFENNDNVKDMVAIGCGKNNFCTKEPNTTKKNQKLLKE